MTDVLLSSENLLERLGHEVLTLKRLGLVNHAEGVKSALAIVIKEIHATRDARTEAKPLPKELA